MKVKMIEGGLDSPAVIELLHEHLCDMARHSAPESVHALNLIELKRSEVRFWSAWLLRASTKSLLGFIALKEINTERAEIKSMRTATAWQRKGIADQMLRHVIETASSDGYSELYLETGSMAAYEPARKLYTKYGFRLCQPFADYSADSNSVFMRKQISDRVQTRD